MPRDTDILRRLRKFELHVVEYVGWQTRGDDDPFSPRGSVDHHTAGGRNGNAPSVGICVNGRTGLAGPLSTGHQARDNTINLLAAGRANHAGSGGWKGLVGNSSMWALERENVGTGVEPWHPNSFETAARFHAACLSPRGNADFVCLHREWTSRKIDSVDTNGNRLRARVAELLRLDGVTPTPQPPKEDDMPAFTLPPGGELDIPLPPVPCILRMATDGHGRPNRPAGIPVRALVQNAAGQWRPLAGNPKDPGMTYVTAGSLWTVDLAPGDLKVVVWRSRDDAATPNPLALTVAVYAR